MFGKPVPERQTIMIYNVVDMPEVSRHPKFGNHIHTNNTVSMAVKCCIIVESDNKQQV